jgi:hypothetical protein
MMRPPGLRDEPSQPSRSLPEPSGMSPSQAPSRKSLPALQEEPPSPQGESPGPGGAGMRAIPAHGMSLLPDEG